MVYNETGTLIAMTQILLPFMILPLYSVMRVIPKSHMRAAQNLGAKPANCFLESISSTNYTWYECWRIVSFCISNWIFYNT